MTLPHHRRQLAAFALLLSFAVSSPVSTHAADGQLEKLEEQAFKQAAALVGPSVVQIRTAGGRDIVGRVLTGTGPTKGVIVSQDGYIISSSLNFIS